MDSQFKEELKMEMPEKIKRQRKKKRLSKPVFKEYEQDQMTFLPQSLEELIEPNNIVRVINEVIEKINISPLLEKYKGGGSSSFHPKMLLKVWIYAITQKVYTGRVIEKMLKENIHFMWISGQNQPGFRTINAFRSGRLKGVIEEIFVETVLFLAEGKYIDLAKYFVDGTKMLADANKNTYVWKKNTIRYKEAVTKRVKELFKQIDELNVEEEAEYGDKNLEETGEESQITSEKIKQQVEKLNKIIKGKNLDIKQEKKAERIIKKLEAKELPKMQKYEEQEEILQERNSYSKTDKDATFIQMKNKEQLPIYLIMAGTENQYIVNYSIHQNASESAQFINHLSKYYEHYNSYPVLISGDSAFGSEENSEHLEQKGITNYLKYYSFYYETTNAYLENIFHKDHFPYDEETDTYICPRGKRMIFQEEVKTSTRTGYIQTARKYRSEDCHKCPYSRKCRNGKGNRTIQINNNLEYHKDIMRKNLQSELGIELRKQRNVDVEPVFGDIKWNQGFRRFKLRGLEKVNVEMGLLSIGHNLRKVVLKRFN